MSDNSNYDQGYNQGFHDAVTAMLSRVENLTKNSEIMSIRKADQGLRLEEILWSGTCLGYQDLLASLLEDWGTNTQAHEAALFYRNQAAEYRLHILHVQSVANAFVSPNFTEIDTEIDKGELLDSQSSQESTEIPDPFLDLIQKLGLKYEVE